MKAQLALLAILALPLPAGAETVRLATEGAFPPFNFVDDNGEVAGLERELGDLLCQRAQLTCGWSVTDWASLLSGLQGGQSDAVLAAVTITPKRQAEFDFTQPYLPPPASVFVAPTGKTDISSGLVAVLTGTVQADYLASEGRQTLATATADQAIAAVAGGKAVAALTDRIFALGAIERAEGNLALAGTPLSLGPGIGIALRRDEPELKASLDQAIGTMKCDGSLDALILKWLGPDADVFGEAGKTQC
ncbi:transporter substrate-binding domain-containing protein [Tabrizicola sp. J26]|uniref:transporter substrate-binding domain-containing protein n=1 Tax=Alitabrizicola rongguiensis TaxID=2909234 RepID=UPI001F48D192|nr:transporter substrate-binding domain-containing protein [Tabrizicola rongguiensis]MCF1709058.1 transporter substrate-binding domain-containing protein [Tabrizicola rongguiensis]